MKIFVLALTLLMAGCVVNLDNQKSQEPQGEYKWVNDEAFDAYHAGKLSFEEVDHKFIVAKAECSIESNKIPIPPPSCTQRPRQDCSGLSGFALGFCQSGAASGGQDCNYASVNAAYRAQDEVFNSCMTLKGWREKWFPFEQPAED